MRLSSARYEDLNREVVDLLEAYGVTSFPLDVFYLAERMGIRLISYSAVSPASRTVLLDISKDAFTFLREERGIEVAYVFYNPNQSGGRLRHSIAHEIAHIWLEHPSGDERHETEANYFAAYLLAPIPLILKHGFSTPSAVREAFLTSLEAASIALERAGNRLRCRKPITDYEYCIMKICRIEGGDRFAPN